MCSGNYRRIGAKCVPCPLCYNGGTCNDEAKCDCLENYAGSSCHSCAEGYFGYACQRVPYITGTVPGDAIDTGGVHIRITGYNFGYTNSTAKCVFGYTLPVDAELISDNELRCSTPPMTLSGSGSMRTDLWVIVDSEYSFNSVPFFFYGLCPDNQCEQGFCSFGKCVCYYGYRGEKCNETLVPPVIADPSVTFELVESQRFSYQLHLGQGSFPIEWSLLGLPLEGMAVNATTGLLVWTSPVAVGSIYKVNVQATNEMTRDIVTLELNVSPSYYVEVSTDALLLIRPAPALTFHFVTRHTVTKEPVGNKIAVMWVYGNEESSSRIRKITVKTNSRGLFSASSFQPYSTDAGVFSYGGEHPTYSNTTTQGQFSIMGVDANKQYYCEFMLINLSCLKTCLIHRFISKLLVGIQMRHRLLTMPSHSASKAATSPASMLHLTKFLMLISNHN